MSKGTAILVAALAGVLVGVPVRAQGPPAIFPWWEGQIASELNLSDAQKQQVESIQREYRTKMIDGRADMAKAELELNDAMDADPFDMRKANDAANKAAKARDEMTRNLTQMGLRLRAVLTKDQWQIARERSQRGPGGPRLARPGGPGFGRGGRPQPRDRGPRPPGPGPEQF